jgi:predicted small lipoprotein YifL
MKYLVSSLLITTTLALAACGPKKPAEEPDGPVENAGEKVDDAVDDAQDAAEDLREDVEAR